MKKKKYWRIPVFLFILLIIFLFIVVYPIITEPDSFKEVAFSPIRIFSIFMVGVCCIGFIISSIIATYHSCKNKKK